MIFFNNFLGSVPSWYKKTIVAFLILNPIIFVINPFVAGWLLIAEFIFTLALALKCYPLPAGGLLAVEAIIIGMAKPDTVYHEVAGNLPVLLLLIFMVTAIHFMKEMLLYIFSKILVKVKSKMALSLLFCFMGAFLSAFLDALTVTAVIISVAYGFYAIYHSYTSKAADISDDSSVESAEDLEEFKGFLRNILMHGAVGTALGGAMTLVGEPQNLLIGNIMNWHFMDFFHYCRHVSVPVLFSGLALCLILEKIKIAGYGYQLPAKVREVLENNIREKDAQMDTNTRFRLITQAVCAVLLILALAFHVAEVGFIGLALIIILSAFSGVTEEHSFGEAFKDAMPFTALLVVFFSIVAVIHEQNLFAPVINFVFSFEGKQQLAVLFLANGALSAISDNVFVATVYITEVQKAYQAGMFDAAWYNHLAVAVNMGTNIPSVATPNGQAAFLFLLTSAIAPLIKLSYMQMVKMALPYAIVLTIVGLVASVAW